MKKSVINFIEKYRYKIEMHAHSSPASPCGVFEPEEVIRLYAECGYNGIVSGRYPEVRTTSKR